MRVVLSTLLLALVGCSSSTSTDDGGAAGSTSAGGTAGSTTAGSGGAVAGAAGGPTGHGGSAGQTAGGAGTAGTAGGAGTAGTAGKGGAGGAAGKSGSSGQGGAGGAGGGGGGGGQPGGGQSGAGQVGGGAGAGGEEAGEPAKALSVTLSDENILNPERGFYDVQSLTESSDWPDFRKEGHSLVYTGVRLDDFRSAPLSDALLAQMTTGFAAARQAGVKVVLRFQYNDGPIGAKDASESRILGHIAQLKPLLVANADVIALVQAGFLGAWGEWHSSTNGLDTDAHRSTLLHALLDAVPASRMVVVRTPHFVDAVFPGGAIKPAEAFSGNDRARVGHHNDCFLASDDDEGTYLDPVATWKAYVGDDGRFTPVGGETCADNAPRSACPSAVAEMKALHHAYLNELYHPDVIAGWKDGGCFADIQKHLGHRFGVTGGSYTPAAKAGGVLELKATVRNDGWGPLYNRRPLMVVLDGQGQRYEATLATDPRTIGPGQETTLAVRLRLPAAAPAGTYRVSLWLPDDAAALRPDARYSVRLANQGVWDSASGLNVLASDFAIDPAAKGTSDPTATGLTVLP